MTTLLSDAILVSKINHILSFCAVVPVLFLHLYSGFREGWFTEDEHHVKKTLLILSISILSLLSVSSTMVFYDWRGKEASCYLVPSFVATIFIFSKQWCLIFLFNRAKVVHLALHLDSRKIVLLRWLVFLSSTIGVVLCFYWAQFTFIHGKVVAESGVCIFYTTSPEEIIIFAVSDALLSFSVLLLFFIPLSAHMRKMMVVQSGRLTSGSADIRTMANRNMAASSFSIGLSLTSLVIMAGIQSTTPIDDPQYDYLLQWAFFPPYTEAWISFLVLHSLTLIWLPKNFRRTPKIVDSTDRIIPFGSDKIPQSSSVA